MERALAFEAAKVVKRALEAGLEDFSAKTVVLPRDEAVLALSIIVSVVEALNKEAQERGAPPSSDVTRSVSPPHGGG